MRITIRRQIVGVRAAALACVAILLFATPCVGADVIDRVLAVVGTSVVTLSDVRAAEAFGLAAGKTPAEILSALVDRELMLGEVDRYAAPDPDASALERRLGEIRARFSTPVSYEQALARTAMTEARLRAVVSENLRIETYVEQRFGSAAQPTPDEVSRYYREHPAEFTRAGRLAPFDEVQPAVQQKLAADRRRELVNDWLERLRRRGQVRIVGQRAPVSEAGSPSTSAAAGPGA